MELVIAHILFQQNYDALAIIVAFNLSLPAGLSALQNWNAWIIRWYHFKKVNVFFSLYCIFLLHLGGITDGGSPVTAQKTQLQYNN